jgi:hypothetical protein
MQASLLIDGDGSMYIATPPVQKRINTKENLEQVCSTAEGTALKGE